MRLNRLGTDSSLPPDYKVFGAASALGRSILAAGQPSGWVEALKSYGVPEAEICLLIKHPETGAPISLETLRKHFAEEIATGAGTPPFAPPTPQPVARHRSSASSLLRLGPTSRVRASPATAPRLPDAGRQGQRRSGQTRDLPGSDTIPLPVMWV
jgi:hypothetical protein